MSLEVIKNEIVIAPAAFDPHCHPRAFDALVQLGGANNIDGKAGVFEYTRSMLFSGFAGGLAMPNESIRTGRLGGGLDAQGYASEAHPHPINSLNRIFEFEQRLGTEAVVDMGALFGLDPNELYSYEAAPINREIMRHRFAEVKGRVLGLKVYVDNTEGGYAIRVEDARDAIEDWQIDHEGEPVVVHAEDENVATVLREVYRREGGKDWAIHIAHVSSRVELEAIIEAKQAGMNVTCEVTPHHLFLTETDRELLGGQGCMKPTLKSKEDVDFLWANIEWIDMFGSDCAPHRPGDKSATPPTFGVTNHPLEIPLLLTEALKEDGRISLEKLEDMLCIQPRQRFNLPADDGSKSVFKIGQKSVQEIEARVGNKYHETPFATYSELVPEDAVRRFNVGAYLSRMQISDSHVWFYDGEHSSNRNELVKGFHRILRPV